GQADSPRTSNGAELRRRDRACRTSGKQTVKRRNTRSEYSTSGIASIADTARPSRNVRLVPILLQKSEIEVRRIFRENTKQEAIADSCTLAGFTEVTGEFNERR